MAQQYGKAEYWEDRYNKDRDPFEWYQRYEGLKDIITQYVKRDARILIVGCGNSLMGENMVDDGYTNIHCIDTSQNVVDQMTAKYKDTYPQLKFSVADVRHLSKIMEVDEDGKQTKKAVYEPDTYDAVIDKACLDSVLCADYSGR